MSHCCINATHMQERSFWLSELRNTSHVNILDNLQIFGSHFEFRPLKKFPQGDFWGLLICCSPLNSASYEPFSSFVQIYPGSDPKSTSLLAMWIEIALRTRHRRIAVGKYFIDMSTLQRYTVSLFTVIVPDFLSPCYSPCAASLAGVPPGDLGLSGLVHEKAHPNTS